ncbi:winged helix-turn-helix domain-containing protein [Thalassomonas haliotis]|uniref:Winged helix-turn-helix domain-containing protein n=1 Tax=Thalassomonas haliotis TaxID=485448 RepID=A0ABY7VB09_9GAMM|nr:winged helix-turn-helix domain-containing protein [Thalassomonas haliotis]WDE10485.1 winged helix-turn-helix domain-containing protein [Thalassomonas haliotis]
MENTQLIKLNQWILDPVENHLIKEDNTCIPLEAKYVLLLEFLAENQNTVISREQLMQTVWNNRYVEYRTINAAISRLRKILGGERDDFIKTHLKRGYSLACRVEYLDKTDFAVADIAKTANSKEQSNEVKQERTSDNKTKETFKKEIKAFSLENNEAKAKEPKSQNEALSHLTNDSEPEITPNSPKNYFSVKPLYKLSVLITTLVITIILWQIIQPHVLSQQILTKDDISIEPLTHSKGWEISPTLSPDKSLLAYTHQSDHASNYSVVIQNLESKETVTVEAENKTFAPYWSPQSNQLFYMSLENNQCSIKKRKVSHTLALSPAELITQCGPYLDPMLIHSIAVSSELNWLYYASQKTELLPSVLYRYHLKNHYTEALTAPQGKYTGDNGPVLSPDNTKLAFKRYYDDHSESIMLLDLNNGDTSSLIKSPSLENTIAWSQSGSHVLYLNDVEKTLKAIHISTGNITPLYQYSTFADHPLMLSATEILLTFEYRYTADVQRINLNNKKLSPEKLIASDFNNHSAAIYNLNTTQRIAFVSNRTGKNQIWLREDNNLQQLTFFEGITRIYEPSFSANGENILFTMNDKLYALNIISKQVTTITPSIEVAQNFTWQCHSNNQILITALKNGIWHLYQVNIDTQEAELLATGISSIQGQCNNAQQQSYYYGTTPATKGIFQLTNNWKINTAYHYFPESLLGYNQAWGVTAKAIYRINGNGELFQADFATGQIQELDIQGINAWFMTIHGDNLLLNNMELSDTYIGKLTISDLTDRLKN